MATVGILYPGFSAEDDYPAIAHLLGGGVRLPVAHTEMPVDAHRDAELREIGAAERLARGVSELAPYRPDAVVWACTSGSFVFGWDGAAQQVDTLRSVAGAPATSTSFAFVAAVRHLGVRRVAVAATYPDDIANRFTDFLARAGVQVLALGTRGIVTAAEVGTLGKADVVAFTTANDHPAAEAVLVPDTALHTVRWLDELEDGLGKPVLTANQVSVWAGLRLAGVHGPRAGLGALFRTEGRP